MTGFTWYFLSIVVLSFAEEENLLSEYDLIVIGGGSGGLAAARAAHDTYKRTVLLLDYVNPSPRKTVWREGGTCMNVGCIPKKIMHQAALLGQAIKDASKYGWQINNPERIKLSWSSLLETVKNVVASSNFITNTQLISEENRIVTDYINGRGEFVDKNTIRVTIFRRSSGVSIKTVKGKKILIAVGGRPKYPKNIPGMMEYAISSDDLFYLSKPPGKTLIIGAGYIAMECAGFLRGVGMDVTVMVRSVVLRKMDVQMAQMVKNQLIKEGVKFLEKSTATKITEESFGKKSAEKRLCVSWTTKDGEKESSNTDCFDTVMVAMGRAPETADLQLNKAGVETTSDGHIAQENTNVENIYAIGDVLYDKPELTPVAIQAAQLLIGRLYGESDEQMDYSNVPTTVFTPLEYSFVGLSEEEAIKKHNDNLEVYHSEFYPLEFKAADRQDSGYSCYLKVITTKEETTGSEIVIGIHLLSPSAGEVMQGFAVAMKAGLTFKQLQDTVGIHPTVAEEFARVHVTKRSGLSPIPASCCS